MNNLVIVESPTKAKTLSRFLGKDYHIEATMGHIRDLPEKKLGIEIKIKDSRISGIHDAVIPIKSGTASRQKSNIYEFIPEYQIISKRKSHVSLLKQVAEKASQVLLATDPDREGEAIAYHVAMICSNSKFKIQNSKLRRIVFHEITESAIKEALLHPREIDMQLVDAQQARRILDRLVGYKLSPLLWNKLGKKWLSAGRVQTVAVRLIVDREREILAFAPVEYWVIEVELQKDDKDAFIARLVRIGEKKAEVKNKETADKIIEDLKVASYSVTNVEKKEIKRYPSPPFTTSTLQQMASNRFGWTAKRTMRSAQNLYEEGLITYHRTDSTNLAIEAIDKVRGYINGAYGREYLPESPIYYKTKSKVAQEAHEAIRPTDVNLQPTSGGSNPDFQLGRDAELLYGLIWKRFVACQMREAVFDQTIVSVEADSYLFEAKGERIKFAGWLIAHDKSKVKSEEEIVDVKTREKELPELTVGDNLNLLQLLPSQKFTEPPARFTEATLIKVLEEKGIGRPSTYAPTISTIQDRGYVEKIERKFKPTDLGFAVNDFLVKHFPDIFAITFTAKMEDDLDEIANGKMKTAEVLNEFYQPFIETRDRVFKEGEKVKIDLGSTDEKCPKCSNNLAIRMSKYGKFLACSNYPNCKFTKNIIEKAGILCPKCGGEILVKKTRRGKQFYGCGNYPKCNFAAWKKEDIK